MNESSLYSADVAIRVRAEVQYLHPMIIGSSPSVPTPLSVLEGPAPEAMVI